MNKIDWTARKVQLQALADEALEAARRFEVTGAEAIAQADVTAADAAFAEATASLEMARRYGAAIDACDRGIAADIEAMEQAKRAEHKRAADKAAKDRLAFASRLDKLFSEVNATITAYTEAGNDYRRETMLAEGRAVRVDLVEVGAGVETGITAVAPDLARMIGIFPDSAIPHLRPASGGAEMNMKDLDRRITRLEEAEEARSGIESLEIVRVWVSPGDPKDADGNYITEGLPRSRWNRGTGTWDNLPGKDHGNV